MGDVWIEEGGVKGGEIVWGCGGGWVWYWFGGCGGEYGWFCGGVEEVDGCGWWEEKVLYEWCVVVFVFWCGDGGVDGWGGVWFCDGVVL